MTNYEVMRAFGFHVYNPTYDPKAEATVDFLKETIEVWKVLTEKDKYRWHDLRKNPEDLPKEECFMVAYEVWDCEWCENRSECEIHTEECDKTEIDYEVRLGNWDEETDGREIAWRYIEPFEEVE